MTSFDTSGNPVTVTLPDCASNKGKEFVVYLEEAGNDLTITTAGADTLGGVRSSFTMKARYDNFKLISTGTSVWMFS
jgi:hypothetical protein